MSLKPSKHTKCLVVGLLLGITIMSVAWWLEKQNDKNEKNKPNKNVSLAKSLKSANQASSPDHYFPRVISQQQPFKGKIVLVTGGTSGIGLATAILFALEGASHVIVCGRQPQKWITIAQPKIQKTFNQPNLQHLVSVIEYHPCDVRIFSQIQQLVQLIVDKYGKLDVAFNNAGVAVGSTIGQQTLASKQTSNGLQFSLQDPQPPNNPSSAAQTLTCSDPSLQTGTSPFCENSIFTDGLGVWNSMKAELAVMIKQLPSNDSPSIINMASINSFWGSPTAAFYGMAKAMVLLATRSLAAEQCLPNPPSYPNLPIRINTIAPGPVYSELLSSQIGPNATYEQVNNAAKAGVPMGRIAWPEEIAPAVLFLADNSKSSYITGASIVIDGGLTASPMV